MPTSFSEEFPAGPAGYSTNRRVPARSSSWYVPTGGAQALHSSCACSLFSNALGPSQEGLSRFPPPEGMASGGLSLYRALARCIQDQTTECLASSTKSKALHWASHLQEDLASLDAEREGCLTSLALGVQSSLEENDTLPVCPAGVAAPPEGTGHVLESDPNQTGPA